MDGEPPPSTVGNAGLVGPGGAAENGRDLRGAPSTIHGTPLRLLEYPARTEVNRNFADRVGDDWDRCFLPETLAGLVDGEPLASRAFVEDDNRSAIDPVPAATLDGLPFYLSVKGVGSATDPFAHRPLGPAGAAELSDDPEVRQRLARAAAGGGVITGELWLRGSPYGGQGIRHARTALAVSERAEGTDLHGFRIAPVVKIAFLPPDLEARLRSIYWYRRYREAFVQELRLVPSNVRFYFQGRATVGDDADRVFDLFGVDTPARAHRFLVNFVRSGVGFLTLFARTMEFDAARRRYRGLDFSDVWLDKDAVLAPDGTAYFVDLEGIDPVGVEEADVPEKLEDQIFRSLYEFMFAYEQLDAARAVRFGANGGRRPRFEGLLEEALATDRWVRLRRADGSLLLELRERGGDERLKYAFPLVDHSRGEL